MKKKLLIPIALVAVLVSGLLISSIPRPELHADFPYYNSIDEMLDRANLIVVGKVVTAGDVQNININADTLGKSGLDSYFIDDTKTTYTVSTIKITKVISGDASVGDIISIKQLGDYKNQPESQLKELDGYFKCDSEHIFFLRGYDSLGLDIPYSTLNPSQGSLEIVDGIIKINELNAIFKDGETVEEAIKKIEIKLSSQ